MTSLTDIRFVEAVHWLQNREAADRPSPIVPELRRRFALSALDACRALRAASERDEKGGAE